VVCSDTCLIFRDNDQVENITTIRYNVNSNKVKEGSFLIQINKVVVKNVTVLKLIGNLDIETAPTLRQEIKKMEITNSKKAVLDLSELELIDSTGVGAIVSFFKRLKVQGGDLKIAHVTGQPKEILNLLGLDKAFDIKLSVEEAVRKLA
jgi:anti-sigma B factor antagonist